MSLGNDCSVVFLGDSHLLRLCALRSIFVIAGKAKFRLEAGENKEIEMKVEKIIYCHCQSPNTCAGPLHYGPSLAVSMTVQPAPRRPLARFVTDLEPRGDVSTHLSRLL